MGVYKLTQLVNTCLHRCGVKSRHCYDEGRMILKSTMHCMHVTAYTKGRNTLYENCLAFHPDVMALFSMKTLKQCRCGTRAHLLFSFLHFIV
jgi:hypothetical protein